jgi:DNA-binding response OmpR family regulator
MKASVPRFVQVSAELASRIAAKKTLRRNLACYVGQGRRRDYCRLKIDTRASVADGRIDLAQEQPFRLGQLAVVPRSRELVEANGARHTLEPRVMQVLVALARAQGGTVGREELIRTCWNGTVVGEDSINRTISVLRKAAARIGGGAFCIETISSRPDRNRVPRLEKTARGGGPGFSRTASGSQRRR